MSKNGILLSVAQNQEGRLPKIVTPVDRLPIDAIGNDVARGKVPGAEPIGSYGEREADAGETNRVVWPNGVFSLPDAAGVQMSIVSTSTDDTDGGTGVNEIEIHYLDADLVAGHEIIPLAGLTPVLTAATNIRFVNCLHIQVPGTLSAASGDITASNGGTTYSQISAGEVRCSSSMRMIPAGKICFVAGAAASSVSGTAAARTVIRIVGSELDNHQYIDPLILMPYGSIAVQDSSEAFNFPVPLRFSAGSVVGLTVTTDKAATVAGSWFGWIEDAA